MLKCNAQIYCKWLYFWFMLVVAIVSHIWVVYQGQWWHAADAQAAGIPAPHRVSKGKRVSDPIYNDIKRFHHKADALQ